jgi:hypothetical protein
VPLRHDAQTRSRWDCLRSLVVAFGLVLLIAALLKAADPWRAIASTIWLGWTHESRSAAVAAIIVVEWSVGSVLICGCAGKHALRFGALFAVCLAATHWGMQHVNGGPCGCFGPVAVGTLPTMLWLLVSGWACWQLSARARPVRTLRRTAVVMSVIAAVVGTVWIGRWDHRRNVAREYMHGELAGMGLDRCWCLVGSTSCDQCHRMAELLGRWKRGVVVFVVSEDDNGGSVVRPAARATVLRVPLHYWWAMVEENVPTVFEWDRLEGWRTMQGSALF